MRGILVAAAGLSLLACGAGSEDDCPSGVRLDGKCLTARDGGAPDVEELVEPTVGGACADERVLACALGVGVAPDAVLSCRSRAYESIATCGPGEACVLLPGATSAHCGVGETARPIALAGTPCTTVDAASCTPDQRALLGCRAGVWQVVESCAATVSCGRTPGNTKGPGWSCPGPSPCAVCR